LKIALIVKTKQHLLEPLSSLVTGTLKNLRIRIRVLLALGSRLLLINLKLSRKLASQRVKVSQKVKASMNLSPRRQSSSKARQIRRIVFTQRSRLPDFRNPL